MGGKKLIVIDLDGTALQNNMELHPETKAALIKAKLAGHKVVIATGRSPRASLNFYQELQLDTPIINYNGSYIHHPTDQNFEEVMDHILIETLNEILDSEIVDNLENVICKYKDNLYILKEDELLETWFYFHHYESVKYGAFKDTMDRHPNGFIIEAKPGTEQKVIDFLRINHSDTIDFRQWTNPYSHIIEVFKNGSNKGIGLAKVAKHLGTDPEDIIVFGDGDNDIEMFQFAGTRIAMENATSPLKAIATETTKLNTEGGVAYYLYKNLLKKSKNGSLLD